MAGLVPFAIGSETAGSITLPASVTGVTAFRPTFGVIGRSGVMTLSESLVWECDLELRGLEGVVY